MYAVAKFCVKHDLSLFRFLRAQPGPVFLKHLDFSIVTFYISVNLTVLSIWLRTQ